MLENCIQKSKDLILMNDSIRKDSKYDNGSYFTLNQQ